MRRGQKTNTVFLGWESSSPPPGVDEAHVGRAPHEPSGAPEPAGRANSEARRTPNTACTSSRRAAPEPPAPQAALTWGRGAAGAGAGTEHRGAERGARGAPTSAAPCGAGTERAAARSLQTTPS